MANSVWACKVMDDTTGVADAHVTNEGQQPCDTAGTQMVHNTQLGVSVQTASLMYMYVCTCTTNSNSSPFNSRQW